LGLVIENWKALIFPIIIAILWNMPYKEKSDKLASNTSKASRETYGHIFTKPKQ
jgi:hypothetical protein